MSATTTAHGGLGLWGPSQLFGGVHGNMAEALLQLVVVVLAQRSSQMHKNGRATWDYWLVDTDASTAGETSGAPQADAPFHHHDPEMDSQGRRTVRTLSQCSK